MVEQLPENENDAGLRIRPVFLTTLCIISYLNCAWILWNALNNMGATAVDTAKQNALITTIGGIFSTIGTVLMWHMRQFGFWLNFAGTIFAIIGPIVIFGLAYVLAFSTGYHAYIGLVLMLLFALNYKHLD